MSINVYSAFNVARLGQFDMIFSDSSGGPYTASITTGKFAHIDMTSVDASATAFATALAAAMNAASPGPTISVTWNASTCTYTFSIASGTLTLSFTGSASTERMRKAVGFLSGKSGSASYNSDTRPFYVIRPVSDGIARTPGEYEITDAVSVVRANDGSTYALSPTTIPIYDEWEHQFESLAAVFSAEATSAVPWTWQHLWAHAGIWQETCVITDLATSKNRGFRLRTPAFERTTHERMIANSDVYWKVRVDAQILGRF